MKQANYKHKAAKAQSAIAWHYTIGLKLPAICESGVLRPTEGYIEPGEKPVCWFSTAPYWEPTSAKGIITRGSPRTLSMQENAEMGEGLYRFGLPTSALIRWPEIGKRAGIRAAMRNALMRVGREQGADPAQWYGTFQEIPIEGLVLQQLVDFRYWATKERLAQRQNQLAAVASCQVHVHTVPLAELRSGHCRTGSDDQKIVNHIRHRLSDYHQLLWRFDAGDLAILCAIRSRVYRAIAAAYPQLAPECHRQLTERHNKRQFEPKS